MHAAIIRRLLAANERLASPENPDAQPIQRIHPKRFEIIIDLNLEYPGGREAARQWVLDNIENAKKQADVTDAGQEIQFEKDRPNSQYLFARLEARAIQRLVALDMEAGKIAAEEIAAKKAAAEKEAAATTASEDNATAKTAAEPPKATAISSKPPDPSKCRAIFHIWPDFEVSACINKSIATVKADAAQNSFSAWGTGITWAVMDSGIRRDSSAFSANTPISIQHQAGIRISRSMASGPFDDKNGHGTHVAGIIAGEWRVPPDAPQEIPRPLQCRVI